MGPLGKKMAETGGRHTMESLSFPEFFAAWWLRGIG